MRKSDTERRRFREAGGGFSLGHAGFEIGNPSGNLQQAVAYNHPKFRVEVYLIELESD